MRDVRIIRYAAVVLLHVLIAQAYPQIAANPTRPSASDNAYVTSKGFFEIEAGFLTDENTWSVPALLKLSASDWFEFGLGVQGNEDDVDLAPQLKYQAAKSDWGAFAVVGRTDFPSGGDPTFTGYGVLSYKLTRFQLDATLGSLIYDSGSSDFGESLFYAAALGTSLGARLGGFVEIFGQNANSVNTLSLDAGLAFNLSPKFVWDAAFAAGLTNDAADWILQMGFTRTLFSLK